jgi:hypothetical protein
MLEVYVCCSHASSVALPTEDSEPDSTAQIRCPSRIFRYVQPWFRLTDDSDAARKRRGPHTQVKRSSSLLNMGCSASRDQHNRFSPSTGSASRWCNPHLPQVSNVPTLFSLRDGLRGGVRIDDRLHTIGHGDADLTFRKTAHAMFFCATNPNPNANGSVWALLQNGTIQRMEEAQEMGSLGGPPAYTEL